MVCVTALLYQMMEDNHIKQKRLLMRANRRGIKEMDVVLGGFARRHLYGLQQLDQFDALLNHPDVDIMNWVFSRTTPPAEFDALVEMIRADAITNGCKP